MFRPLVKTAAVALGIGMYMAMPAHADSMGATDNPKGAGVLPPAFACGPSTPCGPAFGSSSAVFSVASGGCALRNRGDCSIDISAAGPPALAAMIIWTILVPSNISLSDPRVSVIGVTHGEFGVTVQGLNIGTGPSPCWGSQTTASYLAFLPLSIINNVINPTQGNGDYHIFLGPGGSGLTTGENPWDGNLVDPLAEGVSLVIFGSGNKRVAIWGGPGFTGQTFLGGTTSYSLKFAPLPNATPGVEADFVSMYADGQTTVTGYLDDSSLASKAMIINGVNVAGSGSAVNPTSNLDGQDGHPLPQLWDNSEFDIGRLGVFSSTASQLNITVGGANSTDCIVPVAHVIAY